MKRGSMVLIEWQDSNVIHGWQLDDLKCYVVAHCRNVGFLVTEDDEKITIAFGVSDCGSMMETITILKGCIKSIKELRIK